MHMRHNCFCPLPCRVSKWGAFAPDHTQPQSFGGPAPSTQQQQAAAPAALPWYAAEAEAVEEQAWGLKSDAGHELAQAATAAACRLGAAAGPDHSGTWGGAGQLGAAAGYDGSWGGAGQPSSAAPDDSWGGAGQLQPPPSLGWQHLQAQPAHLRLEAEVPVREGSNSPPAAHSAQQASALGWAPQHPTGWPAASAGELL